MQIDFVRSNEVQQFVCALCNNESIYFHLTTYNSHKGRNKLRRFDNMPSKKKLSEFDGNLRNAVRVQWTASFIGTVFLVNVGTVRENGQRVDELSHLFRSFVHF